MMWVYFIFITHLKSSELQSLTSALEMCLYKKIMSSVSVLRSIKYSRRKISIQVLKCVLEKLNTSVKMCYLYGDEMLLSC